MWVGGVQKVNRGRGKPGLQRLQRLSRKQADCRSGKWWVLQCEARKYQERKEMWSQRQREGYSYAIDRGCLLFIRSIVSSLKDSHVFSWRSYSLLPFVGLMWPMTKVRRHKCCFENLFLWHYSSYWLKDGQKRRCIKLRDDRVVQLAMDHSPLNITRTVNIYLIELCFETSFLNNTDN